METIGVVCFIIFTTGTLSSIGVFVKEIIQTKKLKDFELIAFDWGVRLMLFSSGFIAECSRNVLLTAESSQSASANKRPPGIDQSAPSRYTGITNFIRQTRFRWENEIPVLFFLAILLQICCCKETDNPTNRPDRIIFLTWNKILTRNIFMKSITQRHWYSGFVIYTTYCFNRFLFTISVFNGITYMLLVWWMLLFSQSLSNFYF